MKASKSPFRGLALSGFCMQVSILLSSTNIEIYDGLAVMAEDAADETEKKNPYGNV